MVVIISFQLLQSTAGQRSREQLIKQQLEKSRQVQKERQDLCSFSGCSCVDRAVICDCASAETPLTELKIRLTDGLALPPRALSLTIQNCSSVFLLDQQEGSRTSGLQSALHSLTISTCPYVQLAPKSLANLARLTDIALSQIQKLDLKTASLQPHEWALVRVQMDNISTEQIPSDVFGENVVSLESLIINNSRIVYNCDLTLKRLDQLILNNNTIESLHVSVNDTLRMAFTGCNVTRLEAFKVNAENYITASKNTQCQLEGNLVGTLNTERVSIVAGIFRFNDNTIERMEGSQSMDVSFRSASITSNRFHEVSNNLLNRFYQMTDVDLRWPHKKNEFNNNHNSDSIGVTFVGNIIYGTNMEHQNLSQILNADNGTIINFTVDKNAFNCEQCELIQTLLEATHQHPNVSKDSDSVDAKGIKSDSENTGVNFDESGSVNGSVVVDKIERVTTDDKSVSFDEVYTKLYETSICHRPEKDDQSHTGKPISLQQFSRDHMDSNQQCIKKQQKLQLTTSGNKMQPERTSDGSTSSPRCYITIATLLLTLLTVSF